MDDPILQLALPSDFPSGQGDAPSGDTISLNTGERVSKRFAMRLRGQGCVAAKNLPLHALSSGSVYLVTSKGTSREKYFEPLISLLALHQQVLVSLLKDYYLL